jgi:hypothetical protein
VGARRVGKTQLSMSLLFLGPANQLKSQKGSTEWINLNFIERENNGGMANPKIASQKEMKPHQTAPSLKASMHMVYRTE